MSLIQPVNSCQHNILLKYDTDSNTTLNKQQQTLRHTLDKLFPPSQHKHQSVSLQQASRYDLSKLTVQLQQLLQDRKAKLTGLCNVRTDIYNDLFNEIIRQVTIESSIHGQLLHTIYNQYNNAIFAYERLCENSVQYAVEQQCTLEQQKHIDTNKLDVLTQNTQLLQDQLSQLKHELQQKLQQLQYSDDVYERQCNEQIAYWKQNNTYLEQLIAKHTPKNESVPV